MRKQGSRNIGATNVGRVLGRKWGYLCLALDILKGFAPTLAGTLLLRGDAADARRQMLLLGIALAAVLGHVFPLYLRFRGGKGVATTIGVALGIWPYYTVAMAAALAAYAIVRFALGVVSAGSIALAIVFPLAFFAYTRLSGITLAEHWALQAASVFLGLLIIVRHRENIRRLLRGQEIAVRGKPGAVDPGGTSDGADTGNG